MESIGSGWPEPVVMEFPTNSPADSPARVPRRIRRRLLEAKSGSSPSSAEAIEAKLREADLRRQVTFVSSWCLFAWVFLNFLYFTGIRLEKTRFGSFYFSNPFQVDISHIKNWNLVWNPRLGSP